MICGKYLCGGFFSHVIWCEKGRLMVHDLRGKEQAKEKSTNRSLKNRVIKEE